MFPQKIKNPKILMYILYKALNTIFRTKQSVQAQSW